MGADCWLAYFDNLLSYPNQNKLLLWSTSKAMRACVYMFGPFFGWGGGGWSCTHVCYWSGGSLGRTLDLKGMNACFTILAPRLTKIYSMPLHLPLLCQNSFVDILSVRLLVFTGQSLGLPRRYSYSALKKQWSRIYSQIDRVWFSTNCHEMERMEGEFGWKYMCMCMYVILELWRYTKYCVLYHSTIKYDNLIRVPCFLLSAHLSSTDLVGLLPFLGIWPFRIEFFVQNWGFCLSGC